MFAFYHYTSAETLKLILQNQTLRFKSLGFVDDPNEQKTADFGNLGSINYVSCWTSVSDSIPQWSMYGNNFKGVMIEINFASVLDVFETTKFSFDGKKLVDILPLLNPLTTKMVPTNGYLPEIISIKYTDDELLTIPKVVSINEKETIIDLNANGRYKTTNWQFQDEHRFSISVLPWSIGELLNILEKQNENFGAFMLNALSNITLPVEHLDIPLNKDIFNNMKIIFGPKCGNKNKEEIRNLIEKLNFSIPCTDSEVLIR
ncbi:DUF2971 domain-containing protein [Streptococcus hillyeri]|uniref:DUF2971 domain-containing protein n=1 Tax=Streptococcus hillyeri TaxID=2282420 RepID=A0A3L9DK41_9STRE|nr:DUF2971 domain-containing protein [Streptococcus hillyeri]RLY01936.1 DUF2971 domain-containing protein [Streptococcus hillyeri]